MQLVLHRFFGDQKKMTNKKYVVGIAIESMNSHPEYASAGHAILFGAIVKDNSPTHFQYSDLFDWQGGINNKTLWAYSFYPALDPRTRGTFLNNHPNDKKRIERIVMDSLNTKYPFDEFVSYHTNSHEFIKNFMGIGHNKPLIQTNSDNYTYDLIRENCIKFAVTEFHRITGLSFRHSTELFGNTLYLPNTLLEALREYNQKLSTSTEFEALIPHLSADDLNKFIHGEDDWDARFSKL
jgi:hypothetical protein